LNRICEDEHLAEYVNTPFEAQATFGFRKSGLNKAFKFRGFCATHDNEIFADIEKYDFDFCNYHHLMLFSYRAFVSEVRKNEIALSCSKRIFEDTELPQEVCSYFSDSLRGYELAIGDSIQNIKLFNDYFQNSSIRPLEFIVREISFQPICSSGCFTFETKREIISKELVGKPLKQTSNVYFHFIPKDNKSYIVIGFPSNATKCQEYFEQFKDWDESHLRVLATNILLFQIENWVTSLTYKKNVLDKYWPHFIELIEYGFRTLDERQIREIDMFEK